MSRDRKGGMTITQIMALVIGVIVVLAVVLYFLPISNTVGSGVEDQGEEAANQTEQILQEEERETACWERCMDNPDKEELDTTIEGKEVTCDCTQWG